MGRGQPVLVAAGEQPLSRGLDLVRLAPPCSPSTARRVRRLGVARELGAPLDEPRYRERAAAVQIVVHEERGAATAVAAIERLLA
jgi:hypothetical protein